MASEELEDGPAPGQAGQAGKSWSSQAQGRMAIPTVTEAIQLDELSFQHEQMSAFVKELTKDKEDLTTTYNECQSVLTDEFQRLQELLKQREEALERELDAAFTKRDIKLKNQIDTLKKHLQENEQQEEDCFTLLQTMRRREQKREREKKIAKLCQDCIIAGPKIQKVPIDLKHTFRNKDETENNINTFGRLVFKRVETGLAMKLKIKNMIVRENLSNVDDRVEPKDVPLASVSSSRLEYDGKTNEVSFTISIRDANLSDCKEKEMPNEYEIVKRDKTFLWVQCIANNEAVCNWQDIPDVQSCQLLSKLPQKGSKYKLSVACNALEPGMTIHGRVKLVHLEDSSGIEKDGSVNQDFIIRENEWSRSPSAVYGKNVRSPVAPEKPEKPEVEPGRNGNDHKGEEMEMTVPDKLKLKCEIDFGEEPMVKSWTLKKRLDEINLNGLLAQVRKATQRRMPDMPADAAFSFAIDGKEITDDNFLDCCAALGELTERRGENTLNLGDKKITAKLQK